jgi:hypothetical protein
MTIDHEEKSAELKILTETFNALHAKGSRMWGVYTGWEQAVYAVGRLQEWNSAPQDRGFDYHTLTHDCVQLGSTCEAKALWCTDTDTSRFWDEFVQSLHELELFLRAMAATQPRAYPGLSAQEAADSTMWQELNTREGACPRCEKLVTDMRTHTHE